MSRLRSSLDRVSSFACPVYREAESDQLLAIWRHGEEGVGRELPKGLDTSDHRPLLFESADSENQPAARPQKVRSEYVTETLICRPGAFIIPRHTSFQGFLAWSRV
eukprot:s2304_g8.t1